MASPHGRSGDWNNDNGRHMDRDRQMPPRGGVEWYYTQRRAQWDKCGAPTPANHDPYKASHPVYEASPSSGMTQNACSLPVNGGIDSAPIEQQRSLNDLAITPRDKTLMENCPTTTINEIKRWLEKSIDNIVATSYQTVDGTKPYAATPLQTFTVDKMNVVQPSRSQGQPRDKPTRNSDGSREQESTLRLEIQSSSRCVSVKAVTMAPPPVAVVPPLEPEVASHPILERLLAEKWIDKDLSTVDQPLANNSSVHTESQTSSSSQVILAEDSNISHSDSISEDCNEAIESFLDVSSLAVTDYNLGDLMELISKLESSSVPQMNKANVFDALLNCFWGGDIQNMIDFNYLEFKREIAALKLDALSGLKADENKIVFRAVDGISLEELLVKYPSLTYSGSSSPEKFRSSWLNVNENVVDIDQESGEAWPQYFTPEVTEAETRPKECDLDTETSDVEKTEVVEMERGTQTDMETEVRMDMKMEGQTRTEPGVEGNKETEAVVKGPSLNKTERVDIAPESTTATETLGSDQEPRLDTLCDISLCDIKMTLMSCDDAKKMFDQLHNDSTLHIDLSVPLSQTKTGLDDKGTVGQEKQNTPDLLSVEEPARLEMNASEIQDGRRKGLHNILMPEYGKPLSVDSVNSDQEETEEVSMEPESHAEAQDLHGDWTEPISPSDYIDAMYLSDVSSDEEETEAANEEPNEQTEPPDLHGEHAQPTVPGLAIGITNEPEARMLKPLSEERGPVQKDHQLCVLCPLLGPCSPLEEFESVSAFLNFNIDLRRRVMLRKMALSECQDATMGNGRAEMESDTDCQLEIDTDDEMESDTDCQLEIDTDDAESDDEEYECKRQASPAPSESGSDIQCNNKLSRRLTPLIFSDVSEDSADDCTQSQGERPKTSPTERLTSETEAKRSQSSTHVTEYSNVRPPPCPGVQTLLVQSSLPHTARLQLKRKPFSLTQQRHPTSESTKPRAQNPPSHKERPVPSPESSHKSPLRKQDKRENRDEEKSYCPNSPMQKSEKKTEERRAKYEDKNCSIEDQAPQKTLQPERNSSSSKPEFFFQNNILIGFSYVSTKPELPNTPNTPSGPISPVEEKERKGEKRDAEKSSCSESPVSKKVRTDVKRGDQVPSWDERDEQTSSGPKVRGSPSQTGPRIARVPPSPTKGPVQTMDSARKRVLSDWKRSYFPTSISKRRWSGSKEYGTTPLMKKCRIQAKMWTKAIHRRSDRTQPKNNDTPWGRLQVG